MGGVFQQPAKVSDVCDQIRGVSYSGDDAVPKAQDGYLAVLRANNITEEGLTFDDLTFVPAARISEKQLVRSGDVVIAASSGSLSVVGKAAPALTDLPMGFGAFCKVLRPNLKVAPAYFAHYFKTRDYRQKISSLAAGANINNLRNEHLDDLRFPLPPLEEQRRIAAILDQAETLRTQRRQALAHLDTLTQSLFLDMFGDPVRNPKGLPRMKLDELIAEGPQNGLYKSSTEYGSGTPILRIDAFYDGVVTKLNSLKRVRLSPDEIKLFGLAAEDIVINRVNSIEYLGKSALIPPLSEPTVFESNMMRFTVRRDQVEPGYVVHFLQTPFIKGQILSGSKNAVNQSSINQQDVKGFQINVPPLTLQQTFATRIQAIEALKVTHRTALAQLDALFASLQQRAFAGEL